MSNDLQHELSGDWLRNLFKSWGITRWLQELIVCGGMLLLVIVAISMVVPCVSSCIRSMIQKQFNLYVVSVQNKEGGTVESFMAGAGGRNACEGL